MADEKLGILRAMLRYFRFWNWKKARGIIKAADEQFAGSVDGISAAFDIQKDKMVAQYQGLRDAISEVEAVLEDKRARLEALNQEEEELLGRREGALAKAEEAKEANDMKEYEKHAHAFERFQVRIEEIDAAQDRLNKEVTEASAQMDKYMLQLSDFQAQIEKMPQDKAETIADFVSAKQIIELNDRLQGLETSLDKGPISAVLEANKRLTAKARISQKLANADVRLQDKEYERAGRESTAKSKMEQMLAARKLEKEQKTGEPAEKTTEKTDDRPKI
jgi:phage shock protein A